MVGGADVTSTSRDENELHFPPRRSQIDFTSLQRGKKQNSHLTGVDYVLVNTFAHQIHISHSRLIQHTSSNFW